MQSSLTPIVTTADEQVFLIGRPPMSEFLGHITTQTVEGQSIDVKAAAGIWRAANDRVHELEQEEAGWADDPTVGAVPEDLHGLRDAVTGNALVQRAFAIMPFEIGMVELDRMVVYQKHINLAYVNELKSLLGSSPSEEDVFRFALPLDRRYDPQVHVGRIGPNAWSFASPSTDLRVLDLVLLEPSSIQGLDTSGAPIALVGAAIGYGSNFLSALRVEGRLILNNGSHRAYALRGLGISHVPCLIQSTSRPEELELIGVPDVQEHSDLYISHPRPPVLKDYFDDELRMVLHVPRKNRQIRVALQAEVLDVPAS